MRTRAAQEWIDPPPWLTRDHVYGELDAFHRFDGAALRLLKELGGFDEDTGGDLDFLVRLKQAGHRIEVLPDLVLYRRVPRRQLRRVEGSQRPAPIDLSQGKARPRPSASGCSGGRLVNGPLVTVITAAYNAEHYLREALESLFEQDYQPFESIVVDDGSEDATAEIALVVPRALHLAKQCRGRRRAQHSACPSAGESS